MTNEEITNQNKNGRRGRRALRILRKYAKEYGYSVGGHGGSEIDEFMDAIENGTVILVKAEVLNLQPNKDYWLQGEDKE